MSDVKLQMARPVSSTLYMYNYSCCNTTIGANRDYYPIDVNVTIGASFPRLSDSISIIDNDYNDYYYYSYYKKYFFFHLTGEFGVDLWIEICIEDDEYSTYVAANMDKQIYACIT